MIRIEGLVKEYSSKGKKGLVIKRAVDDLSFHIKKGEIFGLLGPNGAGKTTTIRMLTFQAKCDRGDIFYNGMSIREHETEIKRMIGVVPQHINFDADLSVWENMELHGRLYRLPQKLRQERIMELLSFVELEGVLNMKPRALSGGMKRRLLIARALLHKPQMLFMDEPTVALDPQVRRRIWDLIRRLAREGVTVLLTTHYIEEAENLCNRVAIMNKGRLLAMDTPAALRCNMGEIAVEWQGKDGREYKFFPNRREAADFAANLEMAYIRPSNLEDVFIEFTGKREGL